ncbi:hypothetical protein IC575_014328 [Cucumis melo]
MNPTIMVVSLAVAILAAIKVAGHESNDIYLFEIKKAFASQFVYCRNKLGLHPEKINANGGAITIVHLHGATGMFQIQIVSMDQHFKYKILMS